MVRKIPFKSRFVVRFLAALVAVQVAAMGVSGWYFSNRAGKGAVEKAYSADESTVKSVASYLEASFRGFGQDLTLLAATPAMTSFEKLQAGDFMKNYTVSSLFVSGEDLVLFDKDRKRVADNRMTGDAADTSRFAWAERVEAIRPFVGPVIWNGDSPSRLFAVVVQNLATGSGYLQAQYSMRRVFQYLTDTRVGQKGYVVVVDEKGQVLYHPQPKILHDRATLESLGIKGVQPATWKISAPTEFKLVDGERYMVNYAWLTDHHVGVVSLHPMSEIDAVVADTRNGVMALMGLVLLATIVVSAVLGIRMVAPLNLLAGKMQAVRDGDMTVESGIKRPDEIGLLAEVFDLMRERIRQYTEHLEELVDEKMRQVRDILDSIDQGLLTVNLDGTVNPEHSRKANAILHVEDVSKSEVHQVLHLSDEGLTDWKAWVDLVVQKHMSMRWDKLAKVAPVRELKLGDPEDPKYVQVGYQKMLDKQDKLTKIMILAQDVTETRRIERIVMEEKARHENEVKTILGLVNTLPEVLQDYFEDLERRMVTLRSGLVELLEEARRARAEYPDGRPLSIDQDLVASVFRDLHTIKGNSATYGFEKLTHIAHEAEELVEALRPPIEVRSEATIEGVRAKLDEMTEAIEEIRMVGRKLSGGDELVLRIPESRVEAIRDLAHGLARDGGLSPEVARLVEACREVRNIPFARLTEKYSTVVRRLAERLDKLVRFQAVPADLEVDPHFLGRFDEALVHLVRNGVDHAIELPEEREDVGKPAEGTLRLTAKVTAKEIELTLEDDGKGIDGDRLVAKAIEGGALRPQDAEGMTWQQKIELVFQSGISTASEVTDLSGRGVGMDAVMSGIIAMGGRVELWSELGKGTRVTLALPREGV